MLVKLSKWLLLLTLMFSIGAHWAVLQSAAWVGMAIAYSQDGSIKDALEKTFDGKHPCKMCRLIAASKKSEPRQAMQKIETKLDLFCDQYSVFAFSPVSLPPPEAAFSLMVTRSDSPALPPPRQFPA